MLQRSADGQRLNMLGAWSGACTPSQQAYHSTTGELFAQRQVRREGRRAVGRIGAVCWCDNKSGVLQSVGGHQIDTDVRSLRWLADIRSDGSELKNLSGRMQRIADGLSREPWDLTPELQDRKRSIREFKVAEFLDLQGSRRGTGSSPGR